MADGLLSILILTRNEEENLPRCLAAARGLGELIVLDSGSTDRTVEVARAGGAQVFSHPFEAFGAQRNWALDHCEIATPWVLFLDADEVVTQCFCRGGALSNPAGGRGDCRVFTAAGK